MGWWQGEVSGETGCACQHETGVNVSAGSGNPVSSIADAGATALDIFAGGPQKRERTARAMRDAALAEERAATLRLEAAKLEGAAPVVYQGSTGGATAGASWFAGKTFGVPNALLVAGGVALVAYALWPR